VSNQQLTVGGDTNVAKLINARHSVGKGAELQLEVRPVSNFTFNLSGSDNDTRMEDPSLSIQTCFSCTVLSRT
jgi:iron complex outermembrane receptor protein